MQTFKFEAEVNKLLDLMINSLYSNQEIFLRELVSNASDALDKLKYSAQTDAKLTELLSDLKITITCDEKNKTLEVSDNGIGMTYEELKNNLGTIAKSGTLEFFEKLKNSKNVDRSLIGQFGVGFYSSFMVANKVTVISKSVFEEKAYLWSSNGNGEFNIEETSIDSTKNTNGTKIILELKNDLETDYTKDWTIKNIVKKYSNYIAYPILINQELEPLNSMKAIWLKSSSEVSKEEYLEYYKQSFNDFNEPLFYIHSKAEGKIEYSYLIYVPLKAGFNFFNREREKHGVNLYSKQIFIMKECEELLPEYFRFVKGVVDAQDLNLNVSREILQKDKIIEQIRKNLVKKILDKFEATIKENREQYELFFTEYGKILKEGIVNDHENKDKLSKLVMFKTNKSNNKFVTLDEYVNNMKTEQEKIYYISGDNYNTLINSPLLENLKTSDYEVIIMTDPVDEWLTNSLNEYNKKALFNVEKSELKDTEKNKTVDETYKNLFEKLKDALKDNVKDVHSSNKLKNSIACFSSSEDDMSSYMEKILKASGQTLETRKKVLEINTAHPFINKILNINDEEIQRYANIIYDLAVISEGGKLDNPSRFNSYIGDLLNSNL